MYRNIKIKDINYKFNSTNNNNKDYRITIYNDTDSNSNNLTFTYDIISELVNEENCIFDLIKKDKNLFINKHPEDTYEEQEVQNPEYDEEYNNEVPKTITVQVLKQNYEVSDELFDSEEDKTQHYLNIAKKAKLAELEALRYQEETKGTTYQGMFVNTDRPTQIMIMGAAVRAQTDPSFTCRWKMEQGNFVELDAQAIIALGLFIQNYVEQCFLKEAQLTQRVLDAQTIEDVNNIEWN